MNEDIRYGQRCAFHQKHGILQFGNVIDCDKSGKQLIILGDDGKRHEGSVDNIVLLNTGWSCEKIQFDIS